MWKRLEEVKEEEKSTVPYGSLREISLREKETVFEDEYSSHSLSLGDSVGTTTSWRSDVISVHIHNHVRWTGN